ncbi:unnamed protein product [Blepharisma stoltei]|uniref:Enkurin domain-containing protein n=1 Tax=Blepharisma stoltei TaxID=1481888 RepID=A0AAU9JWW4_9CILI|nr:unnamed protein product [Blepharisma stoltei]
MASQMFIDRFKDKVSTMNKLGEFDVDVSKAVNKPAGIPQKSIMQISASNIIKSNYQTSVSPTNEYTTFARPIKLQGPTERSFYAPPSEAASEPTNFHLMNPKSSYYPAPENISHGYSAQQSPRVSEVHQKPKKAASAAPLRKTQETLLSTNSNQLISHAKRRVIDFTPYTLKDYKIIKTEKYYELGGLGPFNIGTEEWEKKKELQDRKKEYAKQVMQANSSLIPPAVLKKPKEKDKEISTRQRAIEFAKKIQKPPLKAKVFNGEIKEEKEEFEDKTLSWLENLEKQHELYKSKAQEIRTKME